MDTLKRFVDMNIWYNRSDVKFEQIKYLKNREMAMLIPSWCSEEIKKGSIRMLKCHSVQHFDYITKNGVRMWDKMLPYNFYYSLAKYKNGIPNQTFNFSERDNTEWSKIHHSVMESYDFLIDIDAVSFDDIYHAHFSAGNIISYFNLKEVPFEVRFSGKGFHIVIPFRYFHEKGYSFEPKSKDSIYTIYSRIARKLSKKFSEMIDIGIYDSRRVCKLPFSLSLYEKFIYVCYPFRDLNEFDDFLLCKFELDNFGFAVKRDKIAVFNENGSIEPLLELIK